MYFFAKRTQFATLAPNLYLLKLNDKINALYLYYYLTSNLGCKSLKDINASTSLGALYKEDVKNINLLYPPIYEQSIIAEALSDVDALIAVLDKKIEKKRLIKQGAMQQLLTGKKRLGSFADKWIEIRLGDKAAMNSGGTPESSNSEYYGDEIPFLSISDITVAGKHVRHTEKAITTKGLNNSSARMFPAGTIMYAMYASLGKCAIADVDLACSQAILGITPSDAIDNEYLYYYLAFIEDKVKDLGQTGTQTNLSKRLVQDFVLNLPHDVIEQQAIASILSDMDKEIADLEARRDKYTQIKSGMMQKLLTGQIRLIQKRQARIIPLDAHIVAGHIVYKLHESRGWGRTKLQKSLHLIGYHCQLDLGNEYIRNTAGPDDQKLMNYIDQKFLNYGQVRKVEFRDSVGRKHYNYVPTAKIDEIEFAFEQYPADTRNRINGLLAKIKWMDLGRAEIISTLYAVWNNRLIKHEPTSDDLLLADFYAWSDHKADFSRDMVLKGLDYMRQEGIIPTGWGKYIDKK